MYRFFLSFSATRKDRNEVGDRDQEGANEFLHQKVGRWGLFDANSHAHTRKVRMNDMREISSFFNLTLQYNVLYLADDPRTEKLCPADDEYLFMPLPSLLMDWNVPMLIQRPRVPGFRTILGGAAPHD